MPIGYKVPHHEIAAEGVDKYAKSVDQSLRLRKLQIESDYRRYRPKHHHFVEAVKATRESLLPSTIRHHCPAETGQYQKPQCGEVESSEDNNLFDRNCEKRHKKGSNGPI